MNTYLQHEQDRRNVVKSKLIDVGVFLATVVGLCIALFVYLYKPYDTEPNCNQPNFTESYSKVLENLNKDTTVTVSKSSKDVYIALKDTVKSSKEEFTLTVEEIESKLKEVESLNIENPFKDVTYQTIPYSSTYSSETLQISDEDYEILLRITEAEAGGEDVQGKRMVVHTILNRVTSSRFPNTVKEVVFQKNSSGTYQYTPITNGRYFSVTPSESTIEAVNQAITMYVNGEDETLGAEFFMSPTAIKYDSAASENGANWQRNNLVLTVTHGTHEFRKYP